MRVRWARLRDLGAALASPGWSFCLLCVVGTTARAETFTAAHPVGTTPVQAPAHLEGAEANWEFTLPNRSFSAAHTSTLFINNIRVALNGSIYKNPVAGVGCDLPGPPDGAAPGLDAR